MNESTLDIITRIFSETLRKPGLKLTPSDTPGTVGGWDSLNHARIITAVEDAFHIEFRLKELASMRSIGDMVSLVDIKTKQQG